jgi:hypothetical protein
MKTLTSRCKFCQGVFEAPLKELKRNRGKFCSLACSSKYGASLREKPKLNVNCALCNKPFYKNTSKLKLSKHSIYFCCRKHKDQGQRIGGILAIQPPHYGNGHSEYRDVAFRKYPKQCNRCGYNKIPGVLVVHHKDRNRKNPVIENLEILCPTCHQEDHYLAKDGLYNKLS